MYMNEKSEMPYQRTNITGGKTGKRRIEILMDEPIWMNVEEEKTCNVVGSSKVHLYLDFEKVHLKQETIFLTSSLIERKAKRTAIDIVG